MKTDKIKWTAIILTCPTVEWTQCLQKELEIRQKKGYLDKDVFLLAVEDPKSGVGSGGSTINALLTVAEYISAQRGYSVLNPDVLFDSHILILHNGRSYAYDACSRPFTTLPAKFHAPDHDGLICMLDVIIKLITEKIAVQASPGVWVSSTDLILTIPDGAEIPWVQCDACAITVPSTPQYCRQHGVYKLNKQGFVEDILYRETLPKMEVCERKDGTVPMVCGLVYFSAVISEKLLALHMKPPLDACTYFGADSGVPPIKLSLFFDVMLPMCSGVIGRDFMSGARSGSFGKDVAVGDIKTMRMARTILWEDLHQFQIRACMIESGECIYPHTIGDHKKNLQNKLMQPCFNTDMLLWRNCTHAHIQDGCSVDSTSMVINSILTGKVNVGAKSVITHSHLRGHIHVGKEAFISGLVTPAESKAELPDHTIVQGYNIHVPTLDKSLYVITTHGRFDAIDVPMWKSTSTFCNVPWLVFMNRTGILKEELWGQGMDPDDCTVYTARVFPVFHAVDTVGLQECLWLQGVVTDTDNKDILTRWRSSWRLSLKDIQELADLKEEFEFRRKLFYNVGQHDIEDTLAMQRNRGFRSLYNSAVVEGYWSQILTTLDSEQSQSSVKAGIAARTLANIADVLGCMAGPKGGLRSGPAANTTWAQAFHQLEKGDIKAGVIALAKERVLWLDRPDKLIRAARHYEGAAQILIRHAVMTAKQFFKFSEETPIPYRRWVVAECPARIDVSGGWSDTPPITYEHGGAVTTVGLLMNGQRPIGAKARRIKEPKLVLVIGGLEKKEVVCTELSDLMDYYQPHSPGALLKAAFVCAEIINLEAPETLAQQLTSKYGGGFELHSWANLPHGSGMGTSSILAGAVMGALLKAAGKSCDTNGLIHLVLYLEQLLTTGGGWQDQVGGLAGGVKLGVSRAQLPLFVDSVDLKISRETVTGFNERLVLIYTGKTRLARNLLQDVLRNWYARNPQIVETEDNLVNLATQCAKYFIEGDLEAVGRCMDLYWRMKKLMAPGCETETITGLIEAFRPHALGICMAGAGGGGFMYVLARDAQHKGLIKELIGTMEGIEAYDACIDPEGMKITIVKEKATWDSMSESDEEDEYEDAAKEAQQKGDGEMGEAYDGGDIEEGGGDRAQGGGARAQGGGDRAQGGGDRAQGGGDRAQGGGDRAQGGGDRAQGGGDRAQETQKGDESIDGDGAQETQKGDEDIKEGEAELVREEEDMST